MSSRNTILSGGPGGYDVVENIYYLLWKIHNSYRKGESAGFLLEAVESRQD